MSEGSLAPAVRRTIEVLECLLAHPQGLKLQEMLSAVDGSRSTLFTLLAALKALGYVAQKERGGRYYAGPRLLTWRAASPRRRHADLLTAFYQEAAPAHLEETLAVAIPLPTGEAEVLGQVEGSAGVRSLFAEGERLPPESAAGRVLHEAPAAEVRAVGYCMTERSDALDIALPLCRDGVRPIAALLWSAPAFRWKGRRDEQRALLPLLAGLAARISGRLGAPLYAPWREGEDVEMQVMAPLTSEQIAGVLAAPWVARLACVGRNGKPHVVPVWYEWDEGRRLFHIPAWRGSRWAEYVLENPQVSLTIDEPWPPLRRVLVRGSAQPAFPGDDPRLKELLARLSRRYLGRSAAALLAPQVKCSFWIAPQSLRGWQGMLADVGRTEER
ncbi:MAG: pyridoxamine 5'-phosphate oxidase family protein [Caldilinea sp.]|nr:pyridoxamine 5'-phosphate oxidase family protein [Caldilinea sp.]MDW8442008.1 pyridoxamine 5'-phosphate oxidase family protein [Caldilineaceae bacterium]